LSTFWKNVKNGGRLTERPEVAALLKIIYDLQMKQMQTESGYHHDFGLYFREFIGFTKDKTGQDPNVR